MENGSEKPCLKAFTLRGTVYTPCGGVHFSTTSTADAFTPPGFRLYHSESVCSVNTIPSSVLTNAFGGYILVHLVILESFSQSSARVILQDSVNHHDSFWLTISLRRVGYLA